MIGTRSPVSCSASRIAAVASKPPISGICTSIRIASTGSRSSAASASRPLAAIVTRCPRRSRRLAARR
ncbi:MAG: hypothetical protein DMG00_26180 [Acidobacteria bacterium]|nr:MAG: hypothetical protein DMG00_26180 [Acidobacteriota bacterium]